MWMLLSFFWALGVGIRGSTAAIAALVMGFEHLCGQA
jgi:hypothetical protein